VLREYIDRYVIALDLPIKKIDFNVLYGAGVYLEEAAAAAARRLKSRLDEPLSDEALSALNTLLGLHGLFVMSSRVGLELMALSREYGERPEDARARREDEKTLAMAINNAKDIFDDEVAEGIAFGVSQPESSVHPERTGALRLGMLGNAIAALAVGSGLGASLSLISVFGGSALGVAWISALIFSESVKKSDTFKNLTEAGGTQVENLVQVLRKSPQGTFRAYKNFILENQNLLRRIAVKPEHWVNSHIDWLKSL
jgi:hypothetical protein